MICGLQDGSVMRITLDCDAGTCKAAKVTSVPGAVTSVAALDSDSILLGCDMIESGIRALNMYIYQAGAIELDDAVPFEPAGDFKGSSLNSSVLLYGNSCLCYFGFCDDVYPLVQEDGEWIFSEEDPPSVVTEATHTMGYSILSRKQVGVAFPYPLVLLLKSDGVRFPTSFHHLYVYVSVRFCIP